MMNLKRYPASFLIGMLIIGLSSCSPESPPSPIASPPSPPVSPPAASPPVNQASPKPSPVPDQSPSKPAAVAKSAPPAKTVPVTIYTIDDRCQEFIAKKVDLPAAQAIEQSVARVLEQNDSADFSLAGYRVTVQAGVATVDLRPTPDAKRKFESLSTCEQASLFGSLEKTLTSNSQWKIKRVEFTDRGNPINL